MPYRKLGRTGENVSLLGIGGAHLGKPKTDAEAVRIVRTAIDNGVNFMDNCWDYNGGTSELRMGTALRDGYRGKVFLMTKIDGQDGTTAQQQLNESLQRLQTDHLDLLQFHEIIRMNDPDRIFARGGAIEAVVDARKAGKVRYIGFTGHKDPQPSENAGNRPHAQFQIRYSANASERNGCSLSEFSAAGPSRARRRRHRRARDEADG